jgi:hypothetical protein
MIDLTIGPVDSRSFAICGIEGKNVPDTNTVQVDHQNGMPGYKDAYIHGSKPHHDTKNKITLFLSFENRS